MNNKKSKGKHSFTKILVNWYEQNKRDLPWRETTDPYKIWLSEIILQQTRVAQGLPYYEKFIANFPNVRELANAPETKILRLWQGLGYYSRAKNLHKCAKLIVNEFDGKFPNTHAALLKLPGIGPYTAAAISSFSYKIPVAVVDGNVFRVLSRVFGIEKDISSPLGIKAFNQLANELIDNDVPDIYNQAIMEFGALQCVPKNPLCNECPFGATCFACSNSLVQELPVKLKKTKVRDRYFNYFVIEMEGQFAMTARESKDIWNGLYDFPLYESQKMESVETAMSNYFMDQGDFVIEGVSKTYKHILSHQRIYAQFIRIGLKSALGNKLNKERFFTIDEMKQLPKPVLVNNYLNEYIF